MNRLVVSVDKKLENAIAMNLEEDQWKICFAEESSFVDEAMNQEADFLLIQVQRPPAFYREELMRLYRAGCTPHLIVFSLGKTNQLASSTSMGKESDAFDQAENDLRRALFLAVLESGPMLSDGFQFSNCADIDRRAARFSHEEHLREIISGVTNEQYKSIVRTQNLDLKPRGHYLLILKAMPYDYFDDYTHNRRVYYLLDELLCENIRRLLSQYDGGEIFEASKNTRCVIINDFNRASSRKYKEDFSFLMKQIRIQTDDGMTSMFLGRRVEEPELFNAVYRECVNAKRMRVFYGEEEILPVSILKQKREQLDMDRLEKCLKSIQEYTLSSDDAQLDAKLQELFLSVLKPSANLNMYYYSCSALNVFYDSFCHRYSIKPERRSMSRCFDKYVTVEEISEHYKKIFRNAKQAVLSVYSGQNLLALQMTSYLQNNYNRDISLSDLAETVGLSRSYTSKCFSSCMGITFSEYLTQLRIAKAKELLAKPDHMKISDVAAAVGFHNAQFFSRTFRKLEGVSPSEYAEILGTKAMQK